jgi:hypothetical protein
MKTAQRYPVEYPLILSLTGMFEKLMRPGSLSQHVGSGRLSVYFIAGWMINPAFQSSMPGFR